MKCTFTEFDLNGKLVLLHPRNDLDDDEKFNFSVRSEIDGLIRIRKRVSRRQHLDEYVIVESKTGDITLCSNHIIANILEPYSNILSGSIHYFLVGFKDKLFHQDRNLRGNILKLYDDIVQCNKNRKREGRSQFGFYPLSFPKELGDRNYLNSVVQEGISLQEGRCLISRGNYDLNSSRTTFYCGEERRNGIFIDQAHPQFAKVAGLLQKRNGLGLANNV